MDNHLEFDHHIKKICNEAWQKISALARMALYLDVDKIYHYLFFTTALLSGCL